METIRIGIIGCGNIFETHRKAIEQTKHTRLVAISDINRKRAKQIGEKYNIAWYTDNKLLLKRKDIDLVSICTPNYLHTSLGLLALRHSKNVLIEKPIGLNIKNIDKLIKYSKKRNKLLFVMHQVRFNPTVQALKKIVEEKKLGKILLVNLIINWFRPLEYFKNKWYGNKKKSGGLLLNQGIHYLDLLQWLFGKANEVVAMKDKSRTDLQIEDLITALINFESGAKGITEINLFTYPKNLECSLTVIGQKGTIKIGGPALNTLEFWCVKNVPQPKIVKIKPNCYANGLYQGSCPNHQTAYTKIVGELSGKDCLETKGEEAKKAVELALAMHKSIKQKKWVKLGE